MRRLVIGWSYLNAYLFCQLKGWDPTKTKIIAGPSYHQNLRAIRGYDEVWFLGPDDMYKNTDLWDIFDALDAQYITPQYGSTDQELEVE